MTPVIITSGEPAGIGPDILLQLGAHGLNAAVIGDVDVFKARAEQLGLNITIDEYQDGVQARPQHLSLIHQSCPGKVVPGQLNPQNAPYVLDMLRLATNDCLSQRFCAMVTAPVNKAIINQAGMPFSGHTEYLASLCHVTRVVMCLACPTMRVALITTHSPLSEVPKAITWERITQTLSILHDELRLKFGLKSPQIYVSGLNPHAGEDGCLGREEIDVIIPALNALRAKGLGIHGPYPADTLFTPDFIEAADAFVTMYHDQGLSVLKYAGFGQAVNITLGLPIIRTSVDHGTALPLAGRGGARAASLQLAISEAYNMARRTNQ